MGFFSCPKKSDNHKWTEEEWLSKPWTEKEKRINAALPHHLWNWKQNDRVWPMCKAYRGDNAIGPRALEIYEPKYKRTPPRLVEGRGIARWMSNGDQSVVDVKMFKDYSRIWTPSNLPDMIECVETQKNGHFGEAYKFTRSEFLRTYGPSSLQKFTDKSYLKRDPYHISYHRMIKRKEQLHVSKDVTGADVVFFWRGGVRWDSLDNYFVKNAIYGGLRWN